jgi:drug/metabolite transporter (DMT)-like permease
MLAIVLALGASLAWGVSDFLGGVKSRTFPLFVVLLISQGAALIVLAAVVAALGEPPPGREFLIYAALAGIAETVGVAALYRGLAVGVMSIVAPVAATAPVVPLVVGLALGEEPATVQAAGIALAVVGIVITASRSDAGDARGQAVGASVLFGALCALGFGSFYVAMDAASEGEIQWALLFARATSVAVFLLVVIGTRPSPVPGGRELPLIAVIGLLIIAADAMYATASTEGVLGVVAALSTLYPIVTIALARVYLSERVEPRQRIGIALALTGVVAISAGV